MIPSYGYKDKWSSTLSVKFILEKFEISSYLGKMQRHCTLNGTDKSNAESMQGKENAHSLFGGLQTGAAIMGTRVSNSQKNQKYVCYMTMHEHFEGYF